MTRRRILVVDDYPASADIICTLFDLLGHTTRAASRGRQALELVNGFDPDIAILDLDLPDISGYEVARALRTQYTGKPLFIAALTGAGQSEDRARALAAGFDHHAVKPVDRAKLQGILALADRTLGT